MQFRSRVQYLVDVIVPAILGIDPSLSPELQLTQAVEANVRWTMRQIAESPEGRARLEAGRMRLVGGIYDLATGEVRCIDLS